MRVLNIHQRELALPPEAVGALIDTLASPGDRLWPRDHWPAMGFDRPLGVGAIGGHGPIRYSVVEYLPGRLVNFQFHAPRGFHGHHSFDVLPQPGGGAILRHTVAMEAHGPARVSWPLIYGPLHDALLEDGLARGQVSLGLVPDRRPWSPWVRFLRWLFTLSLARRRRRR